MTLKLNIYADDFCRKLERTVTANDFELSTGVCEDVLDVLNIDMFEGGISALSQEALVDLLLPIIKNAFPFFAELLAGIFEISHDEVRRTKIREVGKVLVNIVKYSFSELNAVAGNEKN